MFEMIIRNVRIHLKTPKSFPLKDARNKLGLLSDGRYILVAGGSMGAGDLTRIVKLLLEETKEAQIFVVCGSNRKIETGMKKEFLKEENQRQLLLYICMGCLSRLTKLELLQISTKFQL